jgi:hypothetical protein
VGPICQRRKGEAEIPFQDLTRVGFGPVRWLGQIGPLRPFSYFLIFFPFSFSGFSDLFHRICKNASNHFKPLSDIF